MTVTIRIPADASGFQENKEAARQLRQRSVLPVLESGETVRLDFSDVQYATQSFVHALIGEALKKYGIDALDRLEFHKCSPQLRSVVELVVNYSLSGFANSREQVEAESEDA